jgi:hypothetical protein
MSMGENISPIKTELKNFFLGAKFAMSSLHINFSLEYLLTD